MCYPEWTDPNKPANGKMEVTHQDEHIYSVSVYDNKVYLLADKKLYVEDISGNLIEQYNTKIFSSHLL